MISNRPKLPQSPKNAYAVIVAGGGGTRLWPKSRKKTPKQLLTITGKDTLLKLTYDRVSEIFPKERILVITLRDYADEVRRELPKLPKENFIYEPEGKNTAMAMGSATAFVHARDKEAVLINLSADHVIENGDKFAKVVLAALETATKGDYIVTIGMKPTFAHTGLGYIKIGKQLGRVRVVGKDIYAFEGKGFKEKPDLVTAQSFFASGQYLWNAGIYCWSTQNGLEAFNKYAPQLGKLLRKILESVGTKNEESTLKNIYSKAENAQIDIAVSEKASNIAVVPGDFGWSDVGDWKVVYDTLDKDKSGNVIVNEEKSDYVDIGSKNILVETNGRLIVTIGLEDIVVIDTHDAILICNKNKTQDVKKAVEKLKEEKKNKYL